MNQFTEGLCKEICNTKDIAKRKINQSGREKNRCIPELVILLWTIETNLRIYLEGKNTPPYARLQQFQYSLEKICEAMRKHQQLDGTIVGQQLSAPYVSYGLCEWLAVAATLNLAMEWIEEELAAYGQGEPRILERNLHGFLLHDLVAELEIPQLTGQQGRRIGRIMDIVWGLQERFTAALVKKAA